MESNNSTNKTVAKPEPNGVLVDRGGTALEVISSSLLTKLLTHCGHKLFVMKPTICPSEDNEVC